MNILPKILMYLSVLLFCGAMVAALIKFLKALGFNKMKQPFLNLKAPKLISKNKVVFEIIFYCLISRVAIYILGILGYMLVKGEHINFLNSFSTLFVKWDGEHYPFLAENWYVNFGDKKYLLVFFPLYPMTIRLVALLVHNYIVAGFVVSNVFLVIGCIYLYKITEMDFEEDIAMRSVKYLLFFPVSFFLGSTFSESMFFAFTVAAIYYWRKKDYKLTALFGFMGALTRSFGIIIVVPIVINIIIELKTNKKLSKSEILEQLCAVLSPFLGILTYLLINLRVSGSAFTFLKYQKEHWNQSFGFFGSTISTITKNSLTDQISQSASLWIPQLILIFAVLMILYSSIKYLNISYIAYMLAYIFLTISPTWLLSAPRYLLCLFPLYITMGNMGRKRYLDFSFTFLMSLGLGFCTIAFVNGYYIM